MICRHRRVRPPRFVAAGFKRVAPNSWNVRNRGTILASLRVLRPPLQTRPCQATRMPPSKRNWEKLYLTILLGDGNALHRVRLRSRGSKRPSLLCDRPEAGRSLSPRTRLQAPAGHSFWLRALSFHTLRPAGLPRCSTLTRCPDVITYRLKMDPEDGKNSMDGCAKVRSADEGRLSAGKAPNRDVCCRFAPRGGVANGPEGSV